MESNLTSQVLELFSSLTLGLFAGILCNSLFIKRPNILFKWCLFIWGGLAILCSITCVFLVPNKSSIEFIMIIALFIFGTIFLICSIKIPTIKKYYNPTNFDKIINDYTNIADRNEIKLIGGDLNFFGLTPIDMDKNAQYSVLKQKNFNKILVLCEEPKSNDTKKRYGKILHDFVNVVELRFYNPNEADLRIRGRLFSENGIEKLLIYSKVKPQKYKALATDTANENGALYNNIWRLIWSLSIRPSQTDIDGYLGLNA